MKKIVLIIEENKKDDVTIHFKKDKSKQSSKLENTVYNFIFDNLSTLLKEISKKEVNENGK